ncbi:MAG: DUF1552 domain-containing protein [Deltaproteobacteria bacterium]|nr:DUF1552 domain-containing protein [Deltaproteobacteria bacterium]
MALKLDRRTFLLGVGGGVAVSLPVLDCMLDGNGNRAVAQTGAAPSRYALLFGGQALGGDSWAEDSYMIDGTRSTETGHFVAPAEEGAGYTMTTPLEPLATLRDDFSIVSNLAIPFNASDSSGTGVPAGGAYRDFHGGGKSPLLSGTRSTDASFICNGPTSDQIIADMHDGDTTFRHMVMRAQVPFYLSGYDHSGRQYLSYRGAGRSGRIEAQTSPRNAYMSLFTGFVPDDGAGAARLDFELRARRSVLDLIGEKRDRVLARVGRVDQVRLERHFDEIRALELRIAAIPPMATGECQVLPDPGADPSIGSDNSGAGSAEITGGTGYSNEHERARVMCDLIHMGFVCDLSRVATLQITAFQSHMSVLPVSTDFGYPAYADLHELGHNGDTNNRGQFHVSMMLQWHISHYAYLMQKLKDTPEGGGNVLDNSTLVFTAEAGHGRQLNDGSSPNATHCVENMSMLIGGHGGGLRTGQHVRTSGAHPAQALVTAMQAAGYTGDGLGEVTGNIPELLG